MEQVQIEKSKWRTPVVQSNNYSDWGSTVLKQSVSKSAFRTNRGILEHHKIKANLDPGNNVYLRAETINNGLLLEILREIFYKPHAGHQWSCHILHWL